MRNDVAPGAQSFVGFGLLIVAWRVAPDPHSDPMLYVLSGAFAFFGAIVLITGLTRANASPSPFPGLVGRVIWALRPRAWMIAWGLIIAAAWTYGTPHLRWQYAIGIVDASCDYLGWSGVRQWSGNSPGCTLIKFL